jgi:hypothetical protein
MLILDPRGMSIIGSKEGLRFNFRGLILELAGSKNWALLIHLDENMWKKF